MLRRSFIIGAAVFLSFATVSANAAEGFVDYKKGLIKAELAKGKTVFVDYAASWCSTCRVQERVIKSLIKENAAYGKAMTFIRVDWDEFGSEPVSRDRKVPRRSTLLVLKGDKELGRVIAGTSKSVIKKLMDRGL